jgi:hypothetical protein
VAEVSSNEIPYGERSSRVAALQQMLARYGFSPGKIDGAYGTNTRDAVAALQRKLGGVEIDGLWGPETYGAVQADLARADSILRGREQDAIAPIASGIPDYAYPSPGGGNYNVPQATPGEDPRMPPAKFYEKPAFWVLSGVGLLGLFLVTSKKSGSEVRPATDMADLSGDDLAEFLGESDDGADDDGDEVDVEASDGDGETPDDEAPAKAPRKRKKPARARAARSKGKTRGTSGARERGPDGRFLPAAAAAEAAPAEAVA